MTSETTRKTYDVRTHGCQMNVHDSERLAGLLETAGYVDVHSLGSEQPETADVVVFNTCAVRENADNKLYGNLGHLRPAKLKNPDMQIAVGGCLAQKDQGLIADRAPWVDVVFGCRPSSTGHATTGRPRSRSRRASRSSPRPCPPAATPRMPRGSRSRSVATTPAPSASSRACAAPRSTAGRARSSRRSRRS